MGKNLPLGFEIRLRQGDGGTLMTVGTLKDACDVLVDWPNARRGPFYLSARERIEGAIKGETPVREAAEAFLALCEHAGVIIRD